MPNELSPVHPVFHVSMIKKFIGNLVSIIPQERLGVNKSLSYNEVLVRDTRPGSQEIEKQGNRFSEGFMEESSGGGCYLGRRGRYELLISSYISFYSY